MFFQVTHWHSPYFFAYFPAASSYPAMVADMLCGAIGCIGFSWVTETFLYSCIWLSISKLIHIWSVWRFHLHFGCVVSGCQPSLHRARDSDVRLAWEDASAAWVFYSWDTWPWGWCHSGNGHLYVFIACVLWSNTWLATTIKESNQLLHILTLAWRSVALTDTFIHVIV